ncbi:hypothetical protein LXL04_030280 [Taraxacum kok-saghyz]
MRCQGTESGYITFRDVNLKDEDEDSDDQQVQLDDLRRKYVTKMLTSDLNNLKASLPVSCTEHSHKNKNNNFQLPATSFQLPATCYQLQYGDLWKENKKL